MLPLLLYFTGKSLENPVIAKYSQIYCIFFVCSMQSVASYIAIYLVSLYYNIVLSILLLLLYFNKMSLDTLLIVVFCINILALNM